MLFCEKCNLLTDEKVCPSCGSKKLREVADNDYCFFVNLHTFYFSMLEGALKEENIDVVGIPYYVSGVHNGNAGRAEGRRVYVRYKDLVRVNEIYNTIFGIDE